MKVFALLLLAGVSLAAHTEKRGDRDNIDLEDPRFKEYKPLNTYTYEYVACVTSGFPETEQRFAGLKITCEADFFIDSDTRAHLKIRNPILYEVNGTSQYCKSTDSLKISPVSEELVPLLERPIEFEYKDGKVGKIYCEEDEKEYILNIKRGILSVLHHNFTKPEPSIDDKEPRIYKNWEFGSHGMCENLYDVRYLPETKRIKEMQVSKTLNMNNCTGKPRVFSNVPGVRCLNKSCNIDEPLKVFVSTSCDLLGSEDRFVVKKCKTKGKYIFTPTQMKGSGMTITKQYLMFKEVKAGSKSYDVPRDIPRTLEMTHHDEEQKSLTEEERSEIVMKTMKMVDFLIKSVEQKNWMAWRFTALVDTLRKVDKETLLKIWEHCYNDEKHREWLLEALPYVYKEEVFELIAEKIYNRDLEPKLAVPVLRGLALTTNPTEKMCNDISDLCSRAAVQEDETLKMTCYLTSGALMHEYCKKKDHTCLADRATELKNRLLNAKDHHEKMFILKAMGNFGHKTLYKPLLDIIQDNKNTLELRVTAVYALRRIAPKVPQKVLPVLLQVFRQPLSDTELRMACFVIVCDCKPGPAVFSLIIRQLYYERTNQVRSFVVSYIKGMALSKYPCDEKMASNARIALRMLRKYKLTFLSSKWLHFGEYSDLLQMGGSVDFQMISTPSSLIPRALNTKVHMHVLGKSLNLFETGVRGEGIQELLKRVVGPRGHYTKEKSLFGLLRPRRSVNSNLYDKEVKEIQKLLPITEYEEEKAKGSFHFKVLGKELIYNYFTYDDVRELIEDGVIRINGDLKDMLKKGKHWNMTKVFVPLEVKFYQPSCVGLPLKFSLQSVLFLRVNTTVKAEVQPKFFIPLPDQVTVRGKLNVSVLHSTWGKMKVCLPQLETGCKMKMKINMTTRLGGSLQCKLKEQSYTTELDMPKEKREIFSTEKQGYTFLMYTKPVKPEMKDWSSLYRSTKLDGFEIGDVSEIGRNHHHRYANWTLKAGCGKYLSVNEQNELILSEDPTVFRVFFIGMNRQFVKLFVTGKGYVKVKPDSNGCLETVEDQRYPKLFKITYTKGRRHIRLATVVFIHPSKSRNPEEWMKTTAPMNTDQVLLFKHMIEDIEPTHGYSEKWRFVSDLPLEDVPVEDRFHPRNMKIVFITPVEDKVCLRPNKSDESVFTVKRHYTNTSELCYGEQLLGLDVCLSGQYIKPLMPHAPVFPFCGPTKFNVSIKPGQNPTQKIQFTFGKGDRFNEQYRTWKAGMKLVGTNPEKKIETDITYDVDNKKTDFTIDMYNMYPWLRKVCINSHVITSQEIRFNLNFGENCEDYKIQSRIAVKEPGRRELSWVTSYNKIPDTLLKLCYKLLKKFTRQYHDRFSDYQRGQIQRNKVDFTVKFKTEELVDLEVKTPTCRLKMDNVQFESHGFIPRGSNYHSTLMHMLAIPAPVCTVDHDSFKTFDDVEFQYSLPGHCMHVLVKDCTKNNTFMVLMSKELERPDKKVLEIFVEQEKIRIEHLVDGKYQIQVNGEIVNMPKNTFRLKNVATIFVEPEKEELHVSCDIGLELEMVRGSKIDVRVSPYYFNRTCGMCGDCNAEQFRDLKTPMGKVYSSQDRLKYGNLWMVPEETCVKGGCHFKKQYVKKSKTIKEHDCYPTSPLLRCLDKCQATKTKMTLFPMTCVKTGSEEANKILKDRNRRTLDLTGSDVTYEQELSEDIECDCSSCDE